MPIAHRTPVALLTAALVLAACGDGGARSSGTDSAATPAESGTAAGTATPGMSAGATSTAVAGGDTALTPGTLPAGSRAQVPGVTTPPPGAGTATGATAAAPGATGTSTSTATGTATPTAAPAASSDATTAPATAGAVASAPLAPAPPSATPAAAPSADTPASARRAMVPWAPGERIEYDVRLGGVDLGDAAMQVNGLATVRGHETYHVTFRVSGGPPLLRVKDRYESWMDTRTLSSHRHVQDIDEGAYERKSTFEIFHDRGVYRENQKPERPTVAEPLDDGSFFYFVRTVPLEVGRTYTFDRYFKPDRNPVTIKVLRRERVRVPAGTFEAVVVQPIIKTKGIFGEGGRAEIWLADDSTRAMLQMKSQLKFGSLNLYMKRYRAGTP